MIQTLNIIIGFDIRYVTRTVPEWADLPFQLSNIDQVVSCDWDVMQRPDWVKIEVDENVGLITDYHGFLRNDQLLEGATRGKEVKICLTAENESAGEGDGSRPVDSKMKTAADLIANSWSFAAFDVLADNWPMSGLTNGGYRQYRSEIRKDLRKIILNKFCLLETIRDADTIRTLRDTSIPEHRLLINIGIWTLD